MALLSTGSPKSRAKRALFLLEEKCCPDDLNFGHDPEVFPEVVPAVESGQDVDGDSESMECLLDQVLCQGLAANDPTPVPSPFSEGSLDSGVLGSGISTDYEFLSGLLDSDLSFVQNTQFEVYSPTPSPSEGSSMTPGMLEPQFQMPAESSTRKSTSRGRAPEAQKVDPLADRSRKNAEAARQNRIKKKKYVEDLENERTTLKTENVILKTKCHEYQTKCQRLQSELDYLKSVLANDSVLASLIQNIPNVPGVRLTSSFASRKCPNTSEQSGVAKKSKVQPASGGICLHVTAKNLVSLEFCENCSKQALSSSSSS